MIRDLGSLNPYSVGTLMKEAVRRAIVAIRAQRFTFEARTKESPPGYTSPRGDFVTTADKSAQRVFVTLLSNWFPDFGIVAEEEGLRLPCTHPTHDLWFTVDPLDGTRAFMRRQSHGIGTMLALVCDGEVIGACVGDVMTSEVYAARPDDPEVHRISEFGIAERLVIDPERRLAEQWILVGEHGQPRSSLLISMVGGPRPLFSGIETTTGSIGIGIARLWKSEVGAAVFGPFTRGTPWDLYPIVGISQRLGFRFFSLADTDEGDGAQEGGNSSRPGIVPWQPLITREGMPVPHEVMVVHESRVAELFAWSQLQAMRAL